MYIQAVRGGVQIERDEEAFIQKGVWNLIEGLLKKNSLHEAQIISLQFTITDDLQSKNPAAALRKYGFQNVPLFCSQEPRIKGSMPRIIRVLLTAECETGDSLLPLYLGGAEKLRPDLVS